MQHPDVRNLYIHTIGCQMNVYDAEKMAAALMPLGFQQTGTPEGADLIIVNTCAIREKAEQKVFSYLGRLAKRKKHHAGLIVAVGGCVAQQEGQRILDRIPSVDLVFGTHAIGRLASLVRQVEAERTRLVDTRMGTRVDEPVSGPVELDAADSISRFVTIMQGCDNYCTYCVVPHVRGRECSRHPEKIINEIKCLVAGGTREVTLLGQNVNSYGIKEGFPSFADLLGMVDAVKGLKRVRFTTSHPKDLSPDLIRSFGRLDTLCEHIHLPVQSGSSGILQRMNRKYTREVYLEKIEQLRDRCPGIAITADVIVGFPGESEDDFAKTLDLIERVDYDGLFAFKYSDRPSAPARRFSEKVPEPEKSRRLQSVLDLQEKLTYRKNRALVGSVQEVLIEGTSKRVGPVQNENRGNQPQWTGRTRTNKIVHFAAGDSGGTRHIQAGQLVPVQIERAHLHSLWGHIPQLESPHGQTLKGDPQHVA